MFVLRLLFHPLFLLSLGVIRRIGNLIEPTERNVFIISISMIKTFIEIEAMTIFAAR